MHLGDKNLMAKYMTRLPKGHKRDLASSKVISNPRRKSLPWLAILLGLIALGAYIYG